ncbi:phosphopyruvate hydratase [Amycolatopsis sp. NPDC051045]|uniref:phosphopyruvate hydratase n=1 Tax=Amycolatopsis sp. NPDC051045 TaxID=3156922 RepID=UPI0034242194
MFVIDDLSAWEILESRGRPTVAVSVTFRGGATGMTQVPSGGSPGKHGGVERRDGDPRRFGGLGVLGVCRTIETEVRDAVVGRRFAELTDLDRALTNLDGTADKSRLGANTTLGVSQATAVALAAHRGVPLHRLLSSCAGTAERLPLPFFNVVNGGAHATNRLRMLEFMIAPVGAPSIREGVRWCAEIYARLQRNVLRGYGNINLGYEGGFAPDIVEPEEALRLILEATVDAGYTPGTQIGLAIDAEADSLVADGGYDLGGPVVSTTGLVDRYEHMTGTHFVFSVEDAVAAPDRDGWALLRSRLGDRLQLVADAALGTQAGNIRDAAGAGLGNAALIKPNQAGTVTETLEAIAAARDVGWTAMISHRSGETGDTFIADLAVATGVGQIKAGAPAGGERVAKYNRLIEIEMRSGDLPVGPPL